MLGDKIKLLREQKRLTQKELADQIGVGQSTIGMIESGKNKGSNETIVKIAKYFGVSVDYLLDTEDSLNKINQLAKTALNDDSINNNNSKKDDNLIDKYENFPDFEDAEEAIKFVLEQPSVMNYGGYTLKDMHNDEILDLANDILFTIRLSIERRKHKK